MLYFFQIYNYIDGILLRLMSLFNKLLRLLGLDKGLVSVADGNAIIYKEDK